MVLLQSMLAKKEGSKSRYGLPTEGPVKRAGLKDYSVIWLNMA
jgi:hypothetical protein